MRFITLAVICLLTACFTPRLYAQQEELNTGYEMMRLGKFSEAADHFREALTDKTTEKEAYLGLSLVAGNQLDFIGSESNYLKYLSLEDDQERRNAFLEGFWDPRQLAVSPEKLAFLEECVGNDYSRVRTLALSALFAHYTKKGQLAKADDYVAQMGAVPTFSVVGPFENISESGFDRDFGVLEGASPKAEFTNKRGVKVTWFPGTVTRRGTLNFGNHFFTENAVLYAQSFVGSDREREVFLRLGVGGSAKVWVNDELVFAEREERNTNYDAYVFPARLLRGNNRVLVQLGNTGGSTCNFSLRITNEAGRTLEGLTYAKEYAPYKKTKGWEPRRLPNLTETYFKRVLAAGKNQYLNHFALSQYYILDDQHYQRRKLYLDALEKDPDNVDLLESYVYSLDALEDEIGASEIRQRVRELDPNSFTALTYRMNQAKSNEDWQEYAAALEGFRNLVEDKRKILECELTLAGGRKDVESIVSIIETGHKEWPGDSEFVVGQASILKDYHQLPDSALALLEAFNERNFSAEVIGQMITWYTERGKTDRVLELYERLLEESPAGPGYHRRLADVYETRQEYDKAEASYARIVEIAPYVSDFYKAWGDLKVKYGKKEAAAKHYRKAIYLNPYDYDSRNALRDLEGKGGTAFAPFPEKDYYVLAADAKGQTAYPNDHSAIISYDVQQVIHPGGASETRTALLVKTFNSNGVDAWKTYNIYLGNGSNGFVEKAEVIDPDGSRNEASRNGAEVVFDGLKPGGCILIVYRSQYRASGRLAGKFWGEQMLSSSYPADELSYSLLVPKGMEFRYEVTGRETMTAEPERSELDGRDLYVWRGQNHPGETPEANSPSWDDLVANVHVTNVPDWAFIANWYAELTYAKVRPDDYVRQATEALFADAGELTEREEVERIYDFITENIRYVSVPFLQSSYVPQRASKTLTTSQGDCKDVSSLFVAMCKLRGIDANLVLVSTRDRALTPMELPTVAFNHCIGRVELNGKPYYVELTDENLPFGMGDWSVNGAFALTIPAEGEAFNGEVGPINPPTRKKNAYLRTGEIYFEDGDLVYHLASKFVGNNAASIRHDFQYQSVEEQRRILTESLNGLYPRTEIVDFSFRTGESPRAPVAELDFTFRATEPGQEIAGLTIYDIILFDRQTAPDYLATEQRQYPIDLWQVFYGEVEQQTVRVKTPEGKKLVETPEDVRVTNQYFKYSLTYQKEGNDLIVTRDFALLEDVVVPADYPAFREDMRRVVAADKIALAYR